MDLVCNSLTEDLIELSAKLGRAQDCWNLIIASEAAMNDLLLFLYQTDFDLGTVDASTVVPDRAKDVYLDAFRKLMPIIAGYPNQEFANVIKSCVDKLLSRNTWDQFHRALTDFLAELDDELSVKSEVQFAALDELRDCLRKRDEGSVQNLRLRSTCQDPST